jgi:hypothetical protein
MPSSYQRDDARRRIVVTVEGNVSAAEALAVVSRQLADGAWSYGILYDARNDTSQPSTADVRSIVEYVGRCIVQHGPRGPVAIVTRSPSTYGMSRMYSTLGEPVNLTVEVFREIEAAEAWLESQTSPA